MPNVVKVQAGYKAQPLSAYPASSPRRRPRRRSTFPKIDKELVKTNFFEYLDFALQFAPAGPEEKAIRAKLARIGIGPGKTFDFKDLSLEHKAASRAGHEGGRREGRRSACDGSARTINGWQVGSAFGDRAFYNGDWLLRAAAAKARHLRQRRRRGDVSR